MGEFNFHLKELSKRLKKEGQKESIPEGVGTHSKGNQLDQIFLECRNYEKGSGLIKTNRTQANYGNLKNQILRL
ncbi:hypothetical protein OXYTRIMIC_780 [Oxytricha trifallax]|uniref:Uncharacterized protein n=1 Tax=Oxytricha trifallax TaxID=1172189 RepID=A0A073I054_9SPIT|nr:hypothetical protein OXYTRIMIC_780 [Oxytricha trifallax]